jgi:hypothetical protein
MRNCVLFLVLLFSNAALKASWTISFTMSQSGPCPVNASAYFVQFPPVSGLPTQAMCESLRAQILADRQCIPEYASSSPYNYLGDCCIFYVCPPCTGFDDAQPGSGAGTAGGSFSSGGAASGQPFFSQSQNTQNLDWARETQERIKVLGGQMKDLLAKIYAPSTGDQQFDNSYPKQMAAAYSDDSSAVRIGGGELKESAFFYQLQGRQTGEQGAGITAEERYRQHLAKVPVDADGALPADEGSLNSATTDAQGNQELGGAAETLQGRLITGSGQVLADQAVDKTREVIADVAAETVGLELAGGTIVNVADGVKIVAAIAQGDTKEAVKGTLELAAGALTWTSGATLAAGQMVGGEAKNLVINLFSQLNAAVGKDPGQARQDYNDIVNSMPKGQQIIAHSIGMGSDTAE